MMTYLARIRGAVCGLWPCTTCGGGGRNWTSGKSCGVCKGKGYVGTPGVAA